MFRKRRQPAPNFRMPGSPFNPATGERAPLGAYPVRGTTLALFQVVGDDPQDPETADTHDNYVVCRGYEADFDPNFRYLHDPYTKEDTTPINVAKPYPVRGTFPYAQGQVIVAARIKNRLGYNAGRATLPTVGQPEDLDDNLELLLDDDEAGIAWMDIYTQPATSGAVVGSAINGIGGITDSWQFWTGGGIKGSFAGSSYDPVTGEVTLNLASVNAAGGTFIVSFRASISVPTAGNEYLRYRASLWIDDDGTGFSPEHTLHGGNFFSSSASTGTADVTMDGWAAITTEAGDTQMKLKIGVIRTFGSDTATVGQAHWEIRSL